MIKKYFLLNSFKLRQLSRFYTNSVNKNETTIKNENEFINEINTTNINLHVPVMLNEVLDHLVKNTLNFQTYCDLTFGAGGHSEAILKENTNAKVYALDRDPVAFNLANELKVKYPNRLIPMLGKFTQLEKLFQKNNVKENSIDAALIDCGCSSIQLETSSRGFSVVRDGPLDMRMNPNDDQNTITAADVVNKLDEQEIGRILWRYGEEKHYKKIAHGILFFRSQYGDIKTTKQLADIISTIVKQTRFDALDRVAHPGTKTFQALRIFVNNELNELFNAITIIHKYLKPGGRLAVITFHSLEDRIVKSHFSTTDYDTESSCADNAVTEKFSMNLFNSTEQLKDFEKYIRKSWTPINKKVIKPNENEIVANPRSRSAKLRVAIKN